MVTLEFTGICKDCKVAELSLECDKYMGIQDWSVTCAHSKACERVYAKRTAEDIAEEMRRTQGND